MCRIASPQLTDLTVDSQRFTMRLPITIDEAGSIRYAIYRNASCSAGMVATQHCSCFA